MSLISAALAHVRFTATFPGLGEVATPLPRADALVVASGSGVLAAASDAALVDWVRGCPDAARRVVWVCIGAFLRSATGMLDGWRATTRWFDSAHLFHEYPAVRVEPDPIFINGGPAWTSAGVTSGINLALALVEQDLGRAAALAVARYLVVSLKRPGRQSQFSATLSLQAGEDRFSRLDTWMAGHLAAYLSLGAWHGRSG